MADSATPGDTSLADDAHRAKKARVDPDAGTVDTVEQDDAETEDDEAQQDEEEQDDEVEEDDEEDEGSEEEAREQHGEGIEDRVRGEERDEALDGDDSD